MRQKKARRRGLKMSSRAQEKSDKNPVVEQLEVNEISNGYVKTIGSGGKAPARRYVNFPREYKPQTKPIVCRTCGDFVRVRVYVADIAIGRKYGKR